MPELTITIPTKIPHELNPNWQPVGLSDGARRGLKARAIEHLKNMAKRFTQQARNRYWWEQGGQWLEGLDNVHLEATIVLPSRARRWDETNIRAALKPAEDALVQSALLVDDAPGHITWLPIKWARAKEAKIIFRLSWE